MEVGGQHYALAASSLAKEPRGPIENGARWTSDSIWTLWGRNERFSQSDLEICCLWYPACTLVTSNGKI
jgi:hypothetical protein